MSWFISNVRFRVIFAGLILTILITLPSVITWGRYVWEEEITLTLKVNYSIQQDIADMDVMISQ